MAGVTKRDFAATQLCDVSELANLASEHGWAVAPYLPPPAARNAFAHRRYAVEAGAAIFQGPKSDPVKTRTEPRELQDIILRTVEAALAMDLAAAIVADEAGIVLSSDLPVVWVVEALMGGLGWSEVRCSIADGGVNAEATLEEDGSLALLSLVAHPLLGFSEKLDLLLHGPTGSVRLTTSLPLLAAWSAMDDSVEKSARYVVVARSTYRDGQPLMTEAAAAKVLANWAFQSAIDEEVDSAATLGCLRAIRNVARELDLADLAKMLGTLVHWHLSRGTDTQVTIDELQDMLGVAALDVDPPSQMLLS